MSQCPLACGRQKPVSCWRTPLPPQGSLKKPQNPSSLTDDVSCRGLWLDRLFPWTHSLQKHLLSMPTCKGHLSRQGMKKPADSIRTSRAGLIPGRAAQTGCDARGAGRRRQGPMAGFSAAYVAWKRRGRARGDQVASEIGCVRARVALPSGSPNLQRRWGPGGSTMWGPFPGHSPCCALPMSTGVSWCCSPRYCQPSGLK